MSYAFEQYFTSLKDKKIAVLGLGVSNQPLVRLLLNFGCQVTGCDRTPREKLDHAVLELEALGCKLSLVILGLCICQVKAYTWKHLTQLVW